MKTHQASPSTDRSAATECPSRSSMDVHNTFPIDQNGNISHHFKQSSFGNFLETMKLFDDDLFYDHEGCILPLAGDGDTDELEHLHRKTMSSASFIQSLSSDYLLRQLSNEEAHQPRNLSDGCCFASSSIQSSPSPVDSYAPTPPPMPVGSGGCPLTPPGYYPYSTLPPQTSPGMHQPLQQQMQCQHPNPQVMQHHDLLPQNDASLSLPEGYLQLYHQLPTANMAGHQLCAATMAQAGQKPSQRKFCSALNCPNRVVQGGLCIMHGAKRKKCSHPGCTKNVKTAGLCSTHGPERKRCEIEGCTKVSVQGGLCVAHGARKKVCSMEECTKQGILGGMCKKHHDVVNGIVKVRAPRKKAKFL